MKKKQKELFALMSAQHDGLFDEAAGKRLAELLEGDAQAQRYYLELGSLFHELEETFHGQCASAVVEEFPVKRAKIIPMAGWGAAIAASLAAAFLIFPKAGNDRSGLLVDSESTVLMGEERFIIHVVESDGVEWGRRNTAEIRDGELKHGLLDLRSGSMDVMLDNGVRFGFVAPVQMDLTSLNRLSLESGSLVVDVPGLSEGLSINTPDAVVMANTALMHIESASADSTLVYVERGAANLFTEDGTGHEVRKEIVGKESVAIAKGTVDPVTNTRRVTEPRIDLSQPPELEDLKYVHYSFDQVQGRQIISQGNIPNADGWVEGIEAHPEFPEPRRVSGRFGSALEFTGHGEGMLADLKDFGMDEPGSVAFWIKMDTGTVPDPYETIFTWHMYTHPEKKWHTDDETDLACSIHINDKPENGVVGAVWIGFRNKWICGSKDLRDGRWHHVTAVFHRGYQGTMVRHYIDGELARSSARGRTWFPRKRHADIGGGSIAVGRVYWSKRPRLLTSDQSVGLRGMVDELYVFNQAVLPSHVLSLFEKNSPRQAVEVSLAPWTTRALAMVPMRLE